MKMGKEKKNILHIQAICSALSSPERKMAGKYILLFDGPKIRKSYPSHAEIQSFKPKGIGRGGVSYSFFEDCVKYRPSDRFPELQNYLESKYSSNQIRNLSSRVLKKIHDFLLLELNIKRSSPETRHVTMQFVQRNISLLEFLLVRRIFDHFDSMSQKLLKIAISHELYNEACNILRLRISLLVGRITIREFDKIVEDHERYKRISDNINEINLFTSSLQVRFNRKVKNTEIVSYLKRELPRFQDIEKNNKSDTWLLGYYTILLEYCHQIHDYDQADEICFKQLQVFKRSPFLSTKNRIGSTYLQLANNNLFAGRFEISLKYVDSSTKYFKLGYLNYVNACDVKFYSLIYLKKYDQATKMVREILKFKPVQSSDFYYAKWNYFLSVSLYFLNELREAYINLNNSKFLSEDRDGWGINIRILSIMIQVERGIIDGIDFELDNLRKQIIFLKNYVSDRQVLISRLLNQLNKSDFDFNRFDFESNKLYIRLITDSECSWQIKSPEFVVFEHWISKNIK